MIIVPLPDGSQVSIDLDMMISFVIAAGLGVLAGVTIYRITRE